jgi:RNA polymerase sigma-70 factor (ECF subfamily)
MNGFAATAIGQQARSRTKEDLKYDDQFARDYEKYYTKIFAFVYSRVRNVELARDLVSSAFEKAYVKGRNVREPTAYASWLFVIAKNEITGHFRRTGREANHLERAGEELRFTDAPPAPDEYVLRDERVGRLVSFINRLPRRDQEILSLKFDAELKNNEIAKVMDMTSLNVRVTIFRALKRLRKLLEAGQKDIPARDRFARHRLLPRRQATGDLPE